MDDRVGSLGDDELEDRFSRLLRSKLGLASALPFLPFQTSARSTEGVESFRSAPLLTALRAGLPDAILPRNTMLDLGWS